MAYQTSYTTLPTFSDRSIGQTFYVSDTISTSTWTAGTPEYIANFANVKAGVYLCTVNITATSSSTYNGQGFVFGLGFGGPLTSNINYSQPINNIIVNENPTSSYIVGGNFTSIYSLQSDMPVGGYFYCAMVVPSGSNYLSKITQVTFNITVTKIA